MRAPRALACSYSSSTTTAPPPPDKPAVKAPLLQLGPGDSVSVQVYGQPDLSTTVYVADDGTVSVPLAGNIQVAGLSPAQASSRIEAALKSGKILVDPHVTLTVTQTRSQRVSVLGQVGAPGRYAVESNTTIFDLLAQYAGNLIRSYLSHSSFPLRLTFRAQAPRLLALEARELAWELSACPGRGAAFKAMRSIADYAAPQSRDRTEYRLRNGPGSAAHRKSAAEPGHESNSRTAGSRP